MQVMILCGGLGTRIAEEADVRPKPMVEIGGRPILWHIMKLFSHHGFTDFVLCLGHKGNAIRDYFLNYAAMNSDVRISLTDGSVERLSSFHDEARWSVVLAETGPLTPTGGRILKAARYVDGPRFFVTYGDAVADVDLRQLLAFHEGRGRLATVTGVRPSSRFGELRVVGDRVDEFREKPQLAEGWISGGFFVFERAVVERLTDSSVLERECLTTLAAEGQLGLYKHDGYWRPMDTLRERRDLEEEWASGTPRWRVW
jgi:glucose-1-phosphate cytidylyltransferase